MSLSTNTIKIAIVVILVVIVLVLFTRSSMFQGSTLPTQAPVGNSSQTCIQYTNESDCTDAGVSADFACRWEDNRCKSRNE